MVAAHPVFGFVWRAEADDLTRGWALSPGSTHQTPEKLEFDIHHCIPLLEVYLAHQYVCPSVGWCHNFLKRLEGTLPCSNRSTFV